MDSEERPTKLRKLSHDGTEVDSNNTPLISLTATKDTPNDQTSGREQSTDAQEVNEPTLADPLASTDPPLSKRAQKRLAKAAAWEAARGERAALRKEKTAAKRMRQRAQRDATLAEQGLTIADRARMLAREHPRPTQLPLTFLIDCGYDGLMRDNERVSLASQVTRCYGENKRAVWRGHVAVSSFGGKLKERFDGVLREGYRGWKGFRFYEEGFKEVAGLAGEWMRGRDGGELAGPFAEASKDAEGEVVYLSSEAEETLQELKPYGTYIIGGLVDKNREKGICYKAACDAGIRTARLPIGEYLEMQSRKVLATNHVVEIMLKWLEHRDWGKAFLEVIPKRKGGALKGEDGKAANTADDQDGHEHDDDEAEAQDEDLTHEEPAHKEDAQSAT